MTSFLKKLAEALSADLNEGNRVTDFRVDQIEIAEADYWKLPESTRRLIESYASNAVIKVVNGRMVFEMPIYRWEEIQQSMRQLTAAPQPAPGTIQPRRLSGRCADGAERDGGHLCHAVPVGSHKALCGATYGRQSAGWSSNLGTDVTCPRCLRKQRGK